MKAHIIMRSQGEYADTWTVPDRVFLDKDQAETTFAAVEAIYSKYRHLVRRKFVDSWKQVTWYSDDKAVRETEDAIKSEYAALGFDAGHHDSWELVEAELASPVPSKDRGTPL